MSITTRVSLLLALSLFIATSAAGQATTSELVGVVRHEGTALQGATVSIKSPSLQGTRVAVTNENGYFNFGAIPPGSYEVTFELDGMATVVKTMRVGLARTERVDAQMTLVAVSASVTVTASAPTVAETTEIQANITGEEADRLPILRSIQGVAALAPGVTENGPSKSLMLSGAPSYDSIYLVDGAVVNENLTGRPENFFIEDSIEETVVMISSIPAEYGRFTGGVVSAITKSGGNEFSGSLRDSLTNPSWTNPSNYGEPRAESELFESWEATLGGRMVRDRLWFFLAGRYYETSKPMSYYASTIARPAFTTTDERYEVKLTGQLAPKHSLTATYMKYEVSQTNYCFLDLCMERSAIDDYRTVPREFVSANYSGMAMTNLLVEAGWSRRDIRFLDTGGDNPDQVLGSFGEDAAVTGGFFGAPNFCEICGDTDARLSSYYRMKGTYYLATGLGTHSIAAGYEDFSEERTSNNYQSASGFSVYLLNAGPTRDASGNLLVSIVGSGNAQSGIGDLIIWWPILEASQGSDWNTESIYLNDKWDVNNKVNLNLGLRYDKNKGHDSANNPVANDSYISPRLGAIYDIRGDGRFRVSSSYSRYVSRIFETVGNAGSGGGSPSSVYYEYRGPTIGPLPTFDAFRLLFDWFNAQGGTGATDLILGAYFSGYSPQIRDLLDSPNVEEWTIGFGTQIGNRGYARVDYIDRTWHDFFAQQTTPGDTVETPLGTTMDVVVQANDDVNPKRSWDGVVIQAGYRISDRFDLGGNYTWSETFGNYVGEAQGVTSPIPDGTLRYPEYHNFAQNNPTGWLDGDQRHKLRVWLEYEQPLGRFGSLNVSLLERYDSGRPYSAVTWINSRPYVTNPGYLTPPKQASYYFSERGEYRWEDATATDLSIGWEVPVKKVSLFVEGELLNVFDEQAQTGGNASVRVIKAFNPWTTAPVEGVNWVKNSTFGTATSSSHYQTPLTYRFSLGVRF